MTTIKKGNPLNKFLQQYKTKNNSNGPPTHTRIGDESLNVYAGAYNIPNSEMNTFYSLYVNHVFENEIKNILLKNN